MAILLWSCTDGQAREDVCNFAGGSQASNVCHHLWTSNVCHRLWNEQSNAAQEGWQCQSCASCMICMMLSASTWHSLAARVTAVHACWQASWRSVDISVDLAIPRVAATLMLLCLIRSMCLPNWASCSVRKWCSNIAIGIILLAACIYCCREKVFSLGENQNACTVATFLLYPMLGSNA